MTADEILVAARGDDAWNSSIAAQRVRRSGIGFVCRLKNGHDLPPPCGRAWAATISLRLRSIRSTKADQCRRSATASEAWARRSSLPKVGMGLAVIPDRHGELAVWVCGTGVEVQPERVADNRARFAGYARAR